VKLWKSLSATFVSALHHPRLWLLQFFGNVLLALIFIWWLRVDPDTGWDVFLNVLIALIFLAGALLLHGGTLNYCSDVYEGKDGGLKPAFRNALRHLPAIAVSVAIFYVLLYFTDKLDNYQYQLPGYLRSEFPAWLRRRISEPAMDNLYDGLVFVIHWIVIPGLVLPLCLLCARTGFRGFISLRAWWRTVRDLAFWIVLIVAVLIGVYCTGKIMQWKLDPKTATLGAEKVWLAFRLLVVYLMALFSWLWVCSMMARARPQPDPPAASEKVAA